MPLEFITKIICLATVYCISGEPVHMLSNSLEHSSLAIDQSMSLAKNERMCLVTDQCIWL